VRVLRGIGRLARKTAFAVHPRAAILLYHRVTVLERDPFGMAVSPASFAGQMEVLRTRASPISLTRLVALIRGGGRFPPRAVAVTFDDGYADVLEQAKPVLDRYEVPATVFIATGPVASQQEYWWDQIERLAHAPSLPAELLLTIGDRQVRWLAEKEPRTTLLARLHEALLPVREDTRAAALETLHAWAGLPRQTRPTHRVLSRPELQALARGGLIDLGAHSVTHPVLSGLPVDEQRREIAESKAAIEQATGRPVDLFAHPYGAPGYFTDETVGLLRSLGFAAACANVPGRVERTTDPYRLPRYQGRDAGRERFRRWLSSILP
jgi:peptidoglycan/xylan/chitin deacetylase (PgdA/CDA1 family)